jgi:hypothetical protein
MTHLLQVVRRSRASLLATVVLLSLAACAAGPNTAATVGADQAGFWLGLWHGLISPVTFLISLFNDHVAIYEVHNNGNWYNFGFMCGVSCVFSGSARSRSAARKSRRATPHDSA